jgi:hypothetical protein
MADTKELRDLKTRRSIEKSDSLSREGDFLSAREVLRKQVIAQDAEIADLRRKLDFAGEILGKICVYGTLVSGEIPIDPPPHAAVDAILTQIGRAEAAEAKIAALEAELAVVREKGCKG